eukprot:TRINITY_DN8807_c0_g1_i1.p1 TRINITY_DN8807_c0_g1~~TRINITY_DN8807_c0_g1_i1.p1  ORF type:complete len:313 (+),score=37.09 TRINITY_DN8807_c0_g1_i1:153-1091(+)
MSGAFKAIQLVVKYPKIFFGLSALSVVYVSIKTTLGLYRGISAALRRGYNLSVRYGAGSWAVVTGASDGIGAEFCNSLAKRGFNIVLIARNEEKLKAIAQQLSLKFPLVKTKIVVADFERAWEPDFFTRIEEQTKDLDVSMLINNVGVFVPGKFELTPTQDLARLVSINVLTTLMMSKIYIPKMLTRKLRSGIINVSAYLGVRPYAYTAAQCGTKGFVDLFSRSLGYEFEKKIDILSHLCGLVSTKLSNMQPSFTVLTTQDTVEGILRHLGSEVQSAGHWRHQLPFYIHSLFPVWWTKFEWKKIVDRIQKTA